MSKSNTFENDGLKLYFNAIAIPNLADNAVSGPLADLYVALHTADPTDAGTQVTSEAAYTGYVRVPVARTSGGWTVTGNSVSPAANVDFDECTASPGNPLTHFSVGRAASGAGTADYIGTLTPNVTMAVGVIPRVKTTSTITED
jgi:hypothetical protein